MFAGVNVLITQIRNCVAMWNADAKTLAWTATHERILAGFDWLGPVSRIELQRCKLTGNRKTRR
jgi:hypothetical protein